MDPFEIVQWVIRAVLAVLFVGMGVLHFVPGPAKGMSAIIPPGIKRVVPGIVLVRFTGVCEIAGGIGMLVPGLHVVAGIALIVFLVAVFPANAYASRYPERRPGGHPVLAAAVRPAGADRADRGRDRLGHVSPPGSS